MFRSVALQLVIKRRQIARSRFQEYKTNVQTLWETYPSGPICGRETTKSGPEFATSCGHKLRKYGHRRPKYGQLRPFLRLVGRRIHQYFRQSWQLLTNGPLRLPVNWHSDTDSFSRPPRLLQNQISQCTPHSIMFSVCLCLMWTWAKLYKLQFSPSPGPAPPSLLFSRSPLVTDRALMLTAARDK